MPLLKRVHTYIRNYTLIAPGSTIIVGLSGGPDSVFLLHALDALVPTLNLRLIATHLDHEWRAESVRDVTFCAQLCVRLGVHFVAMRASELGVECHNNGSKEDLGRRMRRVLFEQTKERFGAGVIALAHHADDQIETFFVRLARGAGSSGLACMRPLSGSYVRPLLGVRKQEILSYLHERGISYITDASNMSPDFLRNRIRNSVIPELIRTDSRLGNNTLRAVEQLQQTECFLEKLTMQALDACLSDSVLDLTQFFGLDPLLQNRVLVQWLIQEQVSFVLTQKFLNEISRFLRSTKGSRHTFNGWSLVKKGGGVSVSCLEGNIQSR